MEVIGSERSKGEGDFLMAVSKIACPSSSLVARDVQRSIKNSLFSLKLQRDCTTVRARTLGSFVRVSVSESVKAQWINAYIV